MKNDYYNSERVMELRFSELGPCYHLCTQPIPDGLLFRNDEDRISCMNFINRIYIYNFPIAHFNRLN